MKHITLDDIIGCSQELDITCKPRLPVAGIYCPDLLEVHYNPRRIQNRQEFIVTLLHEFVHHIDIEGKLSEPQTEQYAEKLKRNPYVMMYMVAAYSDLMTLHWED